MGVLFFLENITGIEFRAVLQTTFKIISFCRNVSTPSLEEQIVRQEMKNWQEHFSPPFATTNHGEWKM